MSKRNKTGKGKKIFKTLLTIIVLGVITVSALWYFGIIDLSKLGFNIPIKKAEPKIKVTDLNSKTRPYAVMIDNVGKAKPQSGLDKAYIVYEIVVEGGLSRLMAVFRDVDISEIGPTRSARHYFIDYAMENDAIYVHHGRSPQAKAALSKYSIDDLEGLYNPSKMFWRDKGRPAPHNSYTNTDNIKTAAKSKKYEMKSNDWQILKYSAKDQDLSKKEGAIKADSVKVNFSAHTSSTMKYNADKKVYMRYENNLPHKDRKGFQYSTKNIIVLDKINNYTIDTKRQEIDNLGSGTGYFISNGYAVPITWEKPDERSKTVYKYKDGKEIKVNDGITYIEFQPKKKQLEITSSESSN